MRKRTSAIGDEEVNRARGLAPSDREEINGNAVVTAGDIARPVQIIEREKNEDRPRDRGALQDVIGLEFIRVQALCRECTGRNAYCRPKRALLSCGKQIAAESGR